MKFLEDKKLKLHFQSHASGKYLVSKKSVKLWLLWSFKTCQNVENFHALIENLFY